MPRYVDADLLLEQLNKRKSEVAKGKYTEGFNDAIMRVRSMISSSATADVVPKSEVYKLHEVIFKKEDLMQKIAKERNDYYDELQYAKQEVVREIFAEIEQQLRGLFDFFRQDDCIRESSAIMLAISEIAELKKKYIGGVNNENSNCNVR